MVKVELTHLEMPSSSQSLYFHLGMRADDEGFVSSPKRIINMVNSSLDDLKILVAKGLIIEFESGIVVITDWNINNSIRRDRSKKTRYLKEKDILTLTENGSYVIDDHSVRQMGAQCQPSDNQVSAQISIDKISIDKISIDKTREECVRSVVSCYEENVGNLITPTILEEINYYMDHGMECEVICQAIKEAVLKEKRNFSYVKGILNNWMNANLFTMREVIAYQNNFKTDIANAKEKRRVVNEDNLFG